MKKFLLTALLLCFILVACVSAEELDAKLFVFDNQDEISSWALTTPAEAATEASAQLLTEDDLSFVRYENLGYAEKTLTDQFDTTVYKYMSIKYRSILRR